jgi:hypothetical protein
LGTANLLKGIPAKVWMIGGEQGVAEGKIKQIPIGEELELEMSLAILKLLENQK